MTEDGTGRFNDFVFASSSHSDQEALSNLLQIKFAVQHQIAIDIGFDPLGGVLSVSPDDGIRQYLPEIHSCLRQLLVLATARAAESATNANLCAIEDFALDPARFENVIRQSLTA